MSGAARTQNAVRLFLRVQWRGKFPHVYLALAILTVLIVRLAIPPDYVSILLPAFLLGEPGTLGIYLVAAHCYLERTERSVSALAVTPLRSSEYVLGLSIASAIIATGGGAVIWAGVVGIGPRLLLLLPPLFLCAVLSGLIGIAVSAYFSEFTRFLLAIAPVSVWVALPYLSYFELYPRIFFVWSPTDPAMFAFAEVVRSDLEPARYALYVGALLLYAGLAFWWAHEAFRTRVRQRLVAA